MNCSSESFCGQCGASLDAPKGEAQRGLAQPPVADEARSVAATFAELGALPWQRRATASMRRGTNVKDTASAMPA